jgi:uncharacterized protein
MLLDHGADPKLTTKDGATPLHNAAIEGHAPIVEMLLEHGADINARDRETGATPLWFAASFGRLDAVRMLLQHHADRDQADSQGVSPAQAAMKNGYTEVVAALRNR